MARSVSKAIVLAVGIVFGLMLIAGCEEEEKIPDTKTDAQLDITPDAKRSRLIAVENVQLKQQIEKLKEMHAGELQRQKKLNDKEIQKQQRELENCLQAKGAMEEISKKGVETYMQNILGPLTDENAKLQEENKDLRHKLRSLKQSLKKPGSRQALNLYRRPLPVAFAYSADSFNTIGQFFLWVMFLHCRCNEACKHRLGLQGAGSKARMCLSAHKKWMGCDLQNLHNRLIRGFPGKYEAGLFQHFNIARVNFIAMPESQSNRIRLIEKLPRQSL